jgi:hypothetical protein
VSLFYFRILWKGGFEFSLVIGGRTDWRFLFLFCQPA